MITTFEYDGMRSMETDEEEPFSFVTKTLTSGLVKKVTGSRTTSDERFMIVEPSLLVGASSRVGCPLLDVAEG